SKRRLGVPDAGPRWHLHDSSITGEGCARNRTAGLGGSQAPPGGGAGCVGGAPVGGGGPADGIRSVGSGDVEPWRAGGEARAPGSRGGLLGCARGGSPGRGGGKAATTS